MALSILLLLLLVGLAPWIQRRAGRWAGPLMGLVPAGIALALALRIPGGLVHERMPWAEALGLDLSFRLDGWSGLFAVLVAGIGALVVAYAGRYLEDDRFLGRFQSALLLFMASMLGLVLADNLVLLFIFWELTSITSYLLIGHDHDRAEARKAALQALLVTGGGGLLLLAGLVLLGLGSGHWTLSALLADPRAALEAPTASAALVLILLGCFTKSAQVPFHFWLPNAMEAPTPASAYLHSSTMVKAGVYLLGRLLPVLGEHALWAPLLQAAGWATFLLGAFMVLRTTKAKRLLAYTTLSALGLMTLLLGNGGTGAVKAVALLLPAHALYKGALFLLAGALDHETGEKDLARLGGLRPALPTLFAGGLLAALSMAGLAPFLGFLAKEALLEALVPGAWVPLIAMLVALALLGSAGLAAGVAPFTGRRLPTTQEPHGLALELWLAPVLLGSLGLLAGAVPALAGALVVPASQALAPGLAPWHLALWHGFTPAFALGLLALAGAFGLWWARGPMVAALGALRGWGPFGPGAAYDLGLKGLMALAAFQTRLLQTGYLRHYLRAVLGMAVLLPGLVLILQGLCPDLEGWRDLRIHEVGLAMVIVASAVWCLQARSRLAVVVALGLVGYSVALLFLVFGAPDLAMTQFVVETLTVLLFVLTLRKLPRLFRASSNPGRVRDGLVAAGVGLLMAALTLLASQGGRPGQLKDFFLNASYLEAHGRNVVNVILVDFRGLDTLGEITVLAVVALGAFALLRLKLAPDRGRP